jgi:DNA-binding MarR family transcriptional regulator
MAQEQFDISVEQFHILRSIRRGADSISALAAIGGISRPAISQGVDALVHKGLVTRQQSREDRRYVRLELTPQANDLLDAIFARNREWMKTRLEMLPAGELETIIQGLTSLKKALE